MLKDLRDFLRHTGATPIVSNMLEIRARRNPTIKWCRLRLIAMFPGLSAPLAPDKL
jgi:hypothetical protein